MTINFLYVYIYIVFTYICNIYKYIFICFEFPCFVYQFTVTTLSLERGIWGSCGENVGYLLYATMFRDSWFNTKNDDSQILDMSQNYPTTLK